MAAETQVQTWDTSPPRLRTTLQAAADNMSCMVYAPDGKTLATAGNDAVVRVWDAASGQPRSAFKGHSEMVIRLAFSPDGRFLASGGRDRTIQIWDAANDQESTRLGAPTGAVVGIAFSPDGRSVVTASRGGVPAVGPATEGQKRAPRRSRERSPYSTRPPECGGPASRWTTWSLRWPSSPDGKTLVTGGGGSGTSDGLVKLWDLATGTETVAYRPPMPGVISLAFSPDGRTLGAWVRIGGMIQLWEVARRAAVLRLARSRQSGIRPRLFTRRQDPGLGQLRQDGPALGRRLGRDPGHARRAHAGSAPLPSRPTARPWPRRPLSRARASSGRSPPGRNPQDLAGRDGPSGVGAGRQDPGDLRWQVRDRLPVRDLDLAGCHWSGAAEAPRHRIFPNSLAFAPDGVGSGLGVGGTVADRVRLA